MPQTLILCQSVDDPNWIDWSADSTVGGVRVYRVRISEFSAYLSRLQTLLHPDELARAVRYHRLNDRQRFIVARGVLRILLGQHTQQRPLDVEFVTGSTKKPALRGNSGVHYNVSHAGDQVLIAVASQPVGIDVEQPDPDFDYQLVMLENFSPPEREYVGGQPAGRFRFYQLWTRKEALVKGTARGIDDTFWRVPSLDGEHRLPDEWMETAQNWTVSSFGPADGYVAALAQSGTETTQFPAFINVDPLLLDRISC